MLKRMVRFQVQTDPFFCLSNITQSIKTVWFGKSHGDNHENNFLSLCAL